MLTPVEVTLQGRIPPFSRVRDKDERFPWDVTSVGASRQFLWRERERAYAASTTPDCRTQCSGCGANHFCPGGKCDA